MTSLCLCTGLAAQTVAPAAAVEITGSRIRGAQSEGSAPIQVLTREEIQRTGAGSLRELLDGLAAANGGGSSDLGGNASFAGGASGAALRSLGKQSTLVLLNSRRVAPYPLADYSEVFTNIDALPFEAIERIEVLKIGGAAMYGSDAVAGVINVITRSGWHGLQARASHQRSITSGAFGNSTFSLTGGFGGNEPGSGDLLVNLEIYRRQGLMWRQVLGHVRPEYRDASPGFGTYSTYSWPGNVIGGQPVPGCASELLIDGLCRYDRYARFEVVPAAKRANLLISGNQPLGGGRRLFSEVLFADTQTTYRSAFQAYGLALGSITWGNPQTNAAQTFWYRGLPASHPLNSTGEDDAEFRYRFVDAPNESTTRTRQYRALIGLSDTWRGYEWETALGVMGGRSRMSDRGWFSASGFREVIGNDDPNQVDPQFFNRAYRIGQVNSEAVVDRLFPSYGYRGEVRQAFVDGKLSGELMQWPAGALAVATGGELRHEHFAVTPDQLLLSGDIVGNGMVQSDASRRVFSAFLEAEAPLTRTLRLQAAARMDKFQGTAAHVSPKLGARWQADAAVLVRGTLETGFRAPNLTESAASTKYSFDNGLADPRRCPQASALATDLANAAQLLPVNDPNRTLLQARADNLLAVECGASVASIALHNPDLKPESSRNVSFGLVLSPARDWTVSADAWSISRRNEIGLEDTRDLLAAEADRPAGTVNRAALANDRSFSAAEQARYGVTAGALSSIVGRFENVSRTRTQGVDLVMRGRTGTPLGPAELQVDATYLSQFQTWSTVRGSWGDNLSGRNGFPRWRGSITGTLKAGTWAHTARGSFRTGTSLRGDYYDNDYTPEACAAAGYSGSECRVGGDIRWDYGLAYTGFEGLVLAAHVRNVFNAHQPIGQARWLNGGGILPPTDEDAKGRMLRLTLEWRLP